MGWGRSRGFAAAAAKGEGGGEGKVAADGGGDGDSDSDGEGVDELVGKEIPLSYIKDEPNPVYKGELVVKGKKETREADLCFIRCYGFVVDVAFF